MTHTTIYIPCEAFVKSVISRFPKRAEHLVGTQVCYPRLWNVFKCIIRPQVLVLPNFEAGCRISHSSLPSYRDPQRLGDFRVLSGSAQHTYYAP